MNGTDLDTQHERAERTHGVAPNALLGRAVDADVLGAAVKIFGLVVLASLVDNSGGVDVRVHSGGITALAARAVGLLAVNLFQKVNRKIKCSYAC